jgi:alkylation response protein AidB-like acyl-CoA dehydrogenase
VNFGFDEEQKSLGDTVAQMLADHAGLTGPDLGTEHNRAAWDSLVELGLFALLVPERFGGVGLSLVDLALAVEELGAGLAPPTVASTIAVCDALLHHGSDAQQAAWLPRIADGELRIAIAILESDRGYGLDGLATRLDEGKLNGRKILVADAADADLIAVVAQVDGRPGLVLVERSSPGVSLRPHEDLDPTSGFCEVVFDDVGVAGDAMVGGSADARVVERLMDVAATLHAGLLIGIAGRMLRTAVDYAGTRVQFDRPIGAFQAIKHRCADMAVSVEAGRSAAYYAFWAVAEDAPDRARAASMAKAYCGEVARTVCNETIQVHGGMGFTWELGLHRFLRRAKVMEHAFGDQAWHNERIVAQTLAMLATNPDRARDAA